MTAQIRVMACTKSDLLSSLSDYVTNTDTLVSKSFWLDIASQCGKDWCKCMYGSNIAFLSPSLSTTLSSFSNLNMGTDYNIIQAYPHHFPYSEPWAQSRAHIPSLVTRLFVRWLQDEYLSTYCENLWKNLLNIRQTCYHFLVAVELHWCNLICRTPGLWLKFSRVVCKTCVCIYVTLTFLQAMRYLSQPRLTALPSFAAFAGIVSLTLDWRYTQSSWDDLLVEVTQEGPFQHLQLVLVGLRLKELGLFGLHANSAVVSAIFFATCLSNSPHLIKVRLLVDCHQEFVGILLFYVLETLIDFFSRL